MMSLYEKINQSSASLLKELPDGAVPKVGIVLGSGWGAFCQTVVDPLKIHYSKLGFPLSKIEGHSNELVYGIAGRKNDDKQSGIEVLAMSGRPHYYEGYDLSTVVFPVRVLIRSGCDIIILTNAAGGIQAGLSPGDLVLISDHINMLANSPLYGKNDPELGVRFPDMTEIYDFKLRKLAKKAAERIGIHLGMGVYAGVVGPQYETPAEIRMLSRLGVDLVGMSTVAEAIAAHHMGARVLGISCVSNLAAGISREPLTHEEVMEATQLAQQRYVPLLNEILYSIQGAAQQL